MAKVEYYKKGAIAYIKLNRPEVRNAIDPEMVEILNSLWDEFQADKEIRVGIISGVGGHFCSGYDIKDINASRQGGQAYTWNRSSMFGDKRIGPDGHNVTKPLITALDGNVNGAGFWMALQGDIRIATAGAKFGLGEARFNFPVEFSVLIQNHIPRAIAMELLFSLKTFKADRFYELGIINEIVEQERLMETAENIAEKILGMGPLSLMAMKELVNFDPGYAEKVRLSKEKIVPVVNAEDTKEAVRAFVDKRKPEWKLC